MSVARRMLLVASTKRTHLGETKDMFKKIGMAIGLTLALGAIGCGGEPDSTEQPPVTPPTTNSGTGVAGSCTITTSAGATSLKDCIEWNNTAGIDPKNYCSTNSGGITSTYAAGASC